MFGRVRELFTRGVARAGSDGHAGVGDLRRVWASLIRVGLARGLALQDAEDLAQESIVAGMGSFDASRGDFGAFCRTIMANRAISFHRASRPQEQLPEGEDELADPGGGPAWALYFRQCRERTDRIVADTVSSLGEEEAAFFMVLAEVHEELSHGEVSEAARRIGVPPQKGWDIFRRIQRRFRDLEGEIPIPETPPARPVEDGYATRFQSAERRGISLAVPRPPPPDITCAESEYLGRLRERYRDFSTGLPPAKRTELFALLRR